jgi:hypothetical protein
VLAVGGSAQHPAVVDEKIGDVSCNSAAGDTSVTACQLIEAFYGWLVKPSADGIMVAVGGPDE